jgi:hypothetical protein
MMRGDEARTGPRSLAEFTCVGLGMTGDGIETSAGLAEPAVAEITRSKATVCELPSPNRSLMDAGKTPAVMLPSVAVTVIEVDCPAPMVADAGAKVNQLGEAEATALKASGVDVRFEMVNDCGFSVAPGGPRNNRPLGVTTGGAAVPGGTMCKTIAMVTGG